MKPSNKIKPNKLEVAKGQMSKFKGIELPEEIKVEEAHLYHVALVTSTPNTKTLEFDNKLKMQMFNIESWNKVKGNLARVGHGQAFIIHNPVDYKDEQDRMKRAKELEERNAKKAAEEKAAKEKAAKEEKERKAKEAKEKKANEPTFAELKEQAKALGMEVSNTTKKVDVIAFLEAKAKEAQEADAEAQANEGAE